MKRAICYSDMERKLLPEKESLVNQKEEFENPKLVRVGEGDENPFKRLPDDLIVRHIFNKISEAQCLCRCALVSKHFCGLVFQSRTVCFKIPVPIPYQENTGSRPLSSIVQLPRVISSSLLFIYDIIHSTVRKSPSAVDTEFVAQLTANFLSKFQSLKSLYLELDYCGNLEGRDSLVRWKGDSKSDTFILLMAKSLRSDMDDADENGVADEADDSGINPLTVGVEFCLTDVFIRSSFLEILVPLLSKELESIVVVDAEKQGILVLGEDELVQYRNPRTLHYRKIRAKAWSAPVLKLPLSGCYMKTARLLMFKGRDEVDDFSAVEEAFRGHNVFGEAAKELLKNRAVTMEA